MLSIISKVLSVKRLQPHHVANIKIEACFLSPVLCVNNNLIFNDVPLGGATLRHAVGRLQKINDNQRCIFCRMKNHFVFRKCTYFLKQNIKNARKIYTCRTFKMKVLSTSTTLKYKSQTLHTNPLTRDVYNRHFHNTRTGPTRWRPQLIYFGIYAHIIN